MPVLTLAVRDGATPIEVSPYIWRSWTGRRWIDGTEVHGPTFLLGSDELTPRHHARACPCETCRTNSPIWRAAS